MGSKIDIRIVGRKHLNRLRSSRVSITEGEDGPRNLVPRISRCTVSRPV